MVQLRCYKHNGNRIYNLCNHDIYILSNESPPRAIEIPQSGIVARVEKTGRDIERFGGFNIIRDTYGEIYGLPDPQPNTLYVVSAHVLNALNDTRPDVVSVANQIKTNNNVLVAEGFRRKF